MESRNERVELSKWINHRTLEVLGMAHYLFSKGSEEVIPLSRDAGDFQHAWEKRYRPTATQLLKVNLLAQAVARVDAGQFAAGEIRPEQIAEAISYLCYTF